jgi:radical SAM superfamily enzyme YgiQ (UPF0313 family)
VKFLLVSANREKMPYPVYPLGAAFVADAARAAGAEVRTLDFCVETDPHDALAEAIREFAPDAIGFSIRNMDNCSYPNTQFYLPEVREAIRTARRHSKAPVIVGGSAFSLSPDRVLAYLEADIGVAGEGEEATGPALAYATGRGQASFPGLVRRENGGVTVHPPAPSAAFVRAPGPSREWFSAGHYLEKGGMLSVQTRRGCPFHCVYCTYPVLEGRAVRVREPGVVVEEIARLERDHGMDFVFFVDDIFNFPLDGAKELLAAMQRRGTRSRWTCYANPAFVDEELVRLAARTNCMGFEFGTDALDDGVLSAIGKNFTYAQVLSASRLCASAGLRYCHYLLLGGPGETEETLRRTFDRMDEIDPDAVILMTGMRVYPGTALEKIARDEGLASGDLLSPAYYISPAVADGLVSIVEAEANRRKNWVYQPKGVHWDGEKFDAARRFGMRGPLWDFLRRVRGDGGARHE